MITGGASWLKNVELSDPHRHWWDGGTKAIMRLTDTNGRRLFWIVSLVALSVGLTTLLIPKTDYLPEGRQNFIFGIVLPPPGQSVESSREEFTSIVNERRRETAVTVNNDLLARFSPKG